ncbi:hypothetical protein ACQE32_06875 [Pantoea sp. FN0302]|uniref:hypothetical protein n=1 Tax=Pantoea sp. FN0302 TaxID=3418558 RepID=UPI003CED4938
MSQQNVNTTASKSEESSSLKTKKTRRPAKAKADKAAAAAVEQALEKNRHRDDPALAPDDFTPQRAQ